jgi:hypothetical protein
MVSFDIRLQTTVTEKLTIDCTKHTDKSCLNQSLLDLISESR